MCGIFGYIGTNNTPQTIYSGLKRLEYRGYDSWGIAVSHNNAIQIDKKTGPIEQYDKSKLNENTLIGIGHTRWATHGGVTETNAHPHISADGRFTLAQNGIVENYQELKKMLIEKGFEFLSETDTEVIVKMLELELENNQDYELLEAVQKIFLKLDGRNTIIILDSVKDEIIAVRNGSPLVVGIGDNELFIASDTLSFSDKTNKIITLDNNEIFHASSEFIKKYDATNGTEIAVEVTEIDSEETKIDKEGFDHFMIKEIFEQEFTINFATQYTEEEFKELDKALKSASQVYTIAAGSASYVAAEIAWYLRTIADINAIPLKSFEVESYRNHFTDNDIIFVVSQSGESADTIEAVEYAQAKGTKVVSIVNMISSTISRMSDFSFFTRSGPEICVASTKALTAQLAWGYLVAMNSVGKYDEGIKEIKKLTLAVKELFSESSINNIKQLANKLQKHNHAFVLGRENNYQAALEGALKIKEITYLHYEGFAGGELKHGVIALIEEGTPVIVILSDDEEKADMISAVAEVKARGAYTIAIAPENNELYDYWIPTTSLGITSSILNIIPFQLLAYYLALEIGTSPDKPRNLAKSVTVK